MILMKMRRRIKNKSHRYDIKRTRPRYDYEYTKYKMLLSLIMVMCNKQHLSNMWCWIHEKVKRDWAVCSFFFEDFFNAAKVQINT